MENSLIQSTYCGHSKGLKKRASHYNPATGTWFARDPILFNGGQANFYSYGIQDPINYIDPNGESPLSLVIILGLPLVLERDSLPTEREKDPAGLGRTKEERDKANQFYENFKALRELRQPKLREPQYPWEKFYERSGFNDRCDAV